MSLLGADVFVATLEITGTQLDALFATPLEIVPAPAAGLVLKPIAVAARLVRGTAAYTASRNLMIIWEGDTANLVQSVQILFANGPGGTLDQFFHALGAATLTGTNNFDPSGRALQVTIQTGDIGGGAASDRLYVNLLYEVVQGLY